MRKRGGKAIGTWSAFTTVVTIGGPIIGGALGEAGLWRYIFFINIPIGLVSIFILWFKVKESRDEDLDHSLDYPGAIAKPENYRAGIQRRVHFIVWQDYEIVCIAGFSWSMYVVYFY